MATGLALLWQRKSVEVSPIGEPAAVSRRFDWPADAPWAEQLDAINRVFPAWLAQHGWSKVPWTVALPREEAVLRWFEFPLVPDGELPAMVRFQATARSSLPIDQYALDFLPVVQLPGATTREVLATTIPLTQIAALGKLAAGADCELQEVVLSSLALPELARQLRGTTGHPAPRGEAPASELVVVRDGSRLDLVTLSEGEITFAHAARIDPTADSAALLVEVSRGLIAAQKALTGRPVGLVLLLEPTADAALVDQLSERVSAPVHDLRPAWEQRQLGGSATAWGLARAIERSNWKTVGWNLLHPRQPPPVRDPWKQRRAVIGAGVLGVAALAAGTFQMIASGLDASIEAARIETAGLTQQIKTAKPLTDAHNSIKAWHDGGLRPLTELTRLESGLSDTSELYLTDLQLIPGRGDVNGRLQIAGQSISRLAVQETQRRLGASGQWRVGAGEINPSSRDVDYEYRYEFTADILRVPAASPTAPATAPAGRIPTASPTPSAPVRATGG